MKKRLLLHAIICILSTSAIAQYVTIPDAAFRTSLIQQYPSCFNAAQQMDTTCPTIVNLQYFSFVNGGIRNFDGLQYFKSLQSLDWYYLNLDTIPAFPKSLKYIRIYGNNLTALPPLPDSLIELQVYGNHYLTSLPPLPSTLIHLACNACSITSLPALPPSLVRLQCAGNYLTSLPALPSKLDQLICEFNAITTLPTLPNTLTMLSCSYDPLNGLPLLPDSLHELNCAGINMSVLPPLPSRLWDLEISGNHLTSLPPVLPSLLQVLNCGENNLSSIPPLPPQLAFLNVRGNDNITCLPVLPVSLNTLYIDTTRIKCIPNSGAALVIYDSSGADLLGYRVCNAANNINGCLAFPVMHGNVFYDLNNNGVKDAGEYDKRYGRVSLSNGAFTFTNRSGMYELAADTIGSFILSTNAPAFFKAVPANTTYNFSTYDTTVVQNIALQPTVSHDSINVSITPLGVRARPGFGFTYKVSYKNAGSTNLPATIVAVHYNNLLTFDSASYATVTNAGNIVTLNLPSLPVGEFGDYALNFTVSPSAPLGSMVTTYAVMSSGSVGSVDTAKTIVSGSYDPNDKEATPSLTTAQVIDGAYIDYTIRFQNTGTDTAFHVVIVDTLSSQLQANTFELINTSHQCKVTVRDNAAIFEMRNILLPDSNINEPASHGFIRFRIKPVSTLMAGNTVNNEAAIYFDYNSPVITNISTTNIISQTLPLKLISFTGKKEGKTNLLQWSTVNEINVDRFEIERSIDAREYDKIGTIKTKSYQTNSYQFTDNLTHISRRDGAGGLLYRLKMIDRDGSFTYSSIVLIKDITQAGFALQQNPVRNEIMLSSIAPSLLHTEAILVNNIGAVVKRVTIQSFTQIISVSDLPMGMYYLKTVEGSVKVVISR